MSTPYGGGRMPPFEPLARSAIDAARARAGIGNPYAVPAAHAILSEEERAAAQKAAEDEAKVCTLCGGIHPLPGKPACPRLATFEIDGDGRVTKGTFFEGTAWAEGKVVFPADAHEDPQEAAEDDG